MDGVWLDLHALGCFVRLTGPRDDDAGRHEPEPDVRLMVELVRRLEDDLDVSLVRWDRWPLVPTPAGAALLERAEDLLRDAGHWWSAVGRLRHGSRSC